jgi:hypothetical protein
MEDTTGTILQTIALSLPAVALYMTVLNELYVKIEKAEEPMSRNNRPVFAKTGQTVQPDEDNILRGFVTVTRAMNGWDFRLATLSLFFLIISTLSFVLFLAVSINYIRWIGTLTTILGFVALASALLYTACASFFQMYPESS